jgi:ABC-type transporter Mla maintaining outer membrane lipid asymmetry permease subunit MlaE
MTSGAATARDEPRRSPPAWSGLGLASIVSVALVVVAGVALVIRPRFALSYFRSEHLIPFIVGLEVTRAWAPWGAAIVICLHLTALQHRGVRGDEERTRWSRIQRAAIAGGLVPLAYLPVAALALASAMILTRLWLGLSPGAFFELMSADDIGVGVVSAVVLGVLPFGWALLSERLFASSSTGLGRKLFVTWLFIVGVSLAVRVAQLLFSPPGPDHLRELLAPDAPVSAPSGSDVGG